MTVSCFLSFCFPLYAIITMTTKHVFFITRLIKMVSSGPPEYSSWSKWSSCSKTCGDGDRTRTRSCIAYCNDVESSHLSRTETCNVGDCNFFSSTFSKTTMTPTTTTLKSPANTLSLTSPRTSSIKKKPKNSKPKNFFKGKILTLQEET